MSEYSCRTDTCAQAVLPLWSVWGAFKVFALLIVLWCFNYVMSVQLLFTAGTGMSVHSMNHKNGCRLSCALMGKYVKKYYGDVS